MGLETAAMTRRYDKSIDDKPVRHLFECGFTDEKIAARLDVEVRAVQAARFRMKLVRDRGRQPHEREVPPPPPSSPNPVDYAVIQLGAEERPGKGYFLNGVPISGPELVRRVNAKRKASGLEQVGPGAWHV